MSVLFPSAAFALDDAPLTDPEQQGEPTEPVAPDPETPKHPDAPAVDPDAPGVQCAVRFVCQPEETVVTVFDAQEEPVPAEEDGRFALAVGEYTYSAGAEGYVGVSNVPFPVTEEDGGEKEIAVALTVAAPEENGENGDGKEEQPAKPEDAKDGARRRTAKAPPARSSPAR